MDDDQGPPKEAEMTEERPNDEGPKASATGDDWTTGSSTSGGREWLGQLQSMIDNLATQAAPAARQIAAKAAELAAVAADKAGPIAHRAADATESGGRKLAERSRQLAEELRAAAGEQGNGGTGASSGGHPSGTFESEADSSATTDGGTSGTDPAEGRPDIS
jgi:hypothetical protein